MSRVFVLASVCLVAFAASSEVEPNADCSVDNHQQGCSQSEGAVLMQMKTQNGKADVNKGDVNALLNVKVDLNKGNAHHHDTFAEACTTCQSYSQGQTCFAGSCGDDSAKFCWSNDNHDDFKACPQPAKMLLSMNKDIQSSSGEKTNVLGSALQSCSTKGTALTGFTRTGKCEDEGNDDEGSHHVCIKMKADFCTVTGQPNWCGDKMECMDQKGDCPIDHWCVCQWAFASYLESAGGCDKIVDLVCEATNMAAFKAYEKSDDPSHKAALTCIKSKCKVQ